MVAPHKPLSERALLQQPKLPTPGRTTPSAALMSPAAGYEAGIGPGPAEPFFGRPQVADPVIHDGDERSRHSRL